MDSPIGLDYIVENRDYIEKLGSALDTNKVTVKKQIFELFSALCTHNVDGYNRAIEAIEYYQNLKKERYRFKFVVSELERENDVEYQVALLRFINCIINSTIDLQERHRIRNEFIGLKLLQLLSDIRKASNSVNDIIVQLDLFDHHRGCDEAQTLQDPNGINLNSPLDVFYAILRQVADTPQEVHFLSILQHLLRIDSKEAISDVVWRTTEKLVHRATLVESNDDSLRLQRTTSLQMFAPCTHCRNDGSSPTRKPSSPRGPHAAQSAVTVAPRSGTTTTIITITGTQDHKSIPPPPPPPPNCTIIPPPPPQPITSNNFAINPLPPPLPAVTNSFGGPPPPPLPHLSVQHPQRSTSPDPQHRNVNTILLPQQDTPTPKTKMKTINWGKIPPSKVIGKQNIWAIVAHSHQNSPMQGIDWNEMEDLFRQQSTSNHGSPKLGRDSSNDTPDSKIKKEPTEITLLDGKRSLNVNIFLKQFRTSNEDIVQLIRSGDHKSIGSEKLRGLLKILPEVDEVDILRSFSGETNRLGNAEKFLIQLLDIPSYKLRIESMLLKEEFTANLGYLEPCINDLIDAGEDLINNTMLREVLYMVVVAGNFLNSGGYAGNAAGVKLSSLQKLTDIRANKPGMNLIHYVAIQVEKRNPELLKFPTQMPTLENASRTTTDQINNEIQTLKRRIEKIKKQVQSNSTDDDIKEQMVSFLENSEHEVSALQNGIEAVEQMRLKLADFFCEDPTTFKLEECFKIFQTFCDKFKQAIIENEKRKRLEHQASIRRQQREKSRKLKQEANVFDARASPAFQRRQYNSFNCGADNNHFNENMSPDITPTGSLRRRRSRMGNDEDELLVFLENSGPDSNLRDRKSYGSLDRKRPRRRPETINVDFGLDRERPSSPNPPVPYDRPSPVESTSASHTNSHSDAHVMANEDSKPRISSEHRRTIENWLELNDNEDKQNDEYKRKRRQFNANRRSFENESESDRKLDTLPEEEKTISPGPTTNKNAKPDISIDKNENIESYKRVYQDWKPSKSLQSSDIVGTIQAIADDNTEREKALHRKMELRQLNIKTNRSVDKGEKRSPQVNETAEDLRSFNHGRTVEIEDIVTGPMHHSIIEDKSRKAFIEKLGGSSISNITNNFVRQQISQENNATTAISFPQSPLSADVPTIALVHHANSPPAPPPKPKSKITKSLSLTADSVISTNPNPEKELMESALTKNSSNTKAINIDGAPQTMLMKCNTKLTESEENLTQSGVNPKDDTFASLLSHHRNCNENYNSHDGDGDAQSKTLGTSRRTVLTDSPTIAMLNSDNKSDIDNSTVGRAEIPSNNSQEVEDPEANSNFDRYSITRRTTRRPKLRPTDYSSGNEELSITAIHSPSISTNTTLTTNNNISKTQNNNNNSQVPYIPHNDAKLLTNKNKTHEELQITPKKVRVEKFGRPLTTINQEDVQNAIRNLKSPTVVPEGTWFPQRDLTNAKLPPTMSPLSCQERTSEDNNRVSNLSTITKLYSHELNDEGFEETQSLVSDTPSHGKESNNSSCHEINDSTAQSLACTLDRPSKENQKPSSTKPQAAKRFRDTIHNQKLNSSLTQNSANHVVAPRRAISSGPSLTRVHPRTSQNQTVANLPSYHGSNKIRSNGGSTNNTTHLYTTGSKRSDAVVERSGSRNSLRSSRSSINSAGSSNTVRRMPVSIVKPSSIVMRSSLAHASTSKRPFNAQNLPNGRINSTGLGAMSTPRSGAIAATSRSSSSGSSIGHSPLIRKLPAVRPASANKASSSSASTVCKANLNTTTRPREAIIIKTQMVTPRNEIMSRTHTQNSATQRSASTPRSNSTSKNGFVSSFMRPTTASATKVNK